MTIYTTKREIKTLGGRAFPQGTKLKTTFLGSLAPDKQAFQLVDKDGYIITMKKVCILKTFELNEQ